MTIKRIAIEKALSLLNAAGVQYAVIDEEGTHHGTLKVAPVPSKTVVNKFIHIYEPVMKGIRPNGSGTIHFPPEWGDDEAGVRLKDSLQSSACSWASRNWGPAETHYFTHRHKNGIEVMRLNPVSLVPQTQPQAQASLVTQ